jgi:methyl-accepting chemotaxis protein
MTLSERVSGLFAGGEAESHGAADTEKYDSVSIKSSDDIERIFDEMAAALPDETPMEPIERAHQRVQERVSDGSLQRDGESSKAGTEDVAADGGVAAESGGASPVETGQLPVAMEYTLDRVGTPIFTLDADGNIVHWNTRLEELTGVDAEDARSMEMASQAFYPDGRRGKTLADKVLDHPESVDEEFGIGRAEDVAFTMYEDESTMVDRNDVERHISFSAAPLYDDAGTLVGVVEMVNDRTTDVRRTQETEALVAELQETIDSLRAGDHDARAAYAGAGYLDESLLDVMDGLNALAGQFEALSTHVVGQVEELQDSSETVAGTARDIDGLASDQSDTMGTISAEVANLSATVEEIASTADEVQARGNRADELAVEGRDSAAEALDAMESVDQATDSVATDVERLHERVGQIDEIATVINNIAEQTNMLALNANIEAARAGQAGEGFAVVADEVKTLAEESQDHANDIETTIANIQEDTTETIEGIAETTQEVESGIEQVQTVMERLEAIVEAVREASQGIDEVADATDDQAASAEEVASMIDEASIMADDVATQIGNIAAETDQQQRRVQEVRQALEENTV